MENISDFNKNIAVLYEKDSSIDKTVAIKDLLSCDEVGLEIVKRFVIDRSNRVSVRLLALVELWNAKEAEQEWIISIIESEEEYLFLQQDFLDFLHKNNDDSWLEKLAESQNEQLKVKASEVLLGKLENQISQLNASLYPYQQSLEVEVKKLEAISLKLESEKREEEYLYREIEAIRKKVEQTEQRKQKLNLEISKQTELVNHSQASLNSIQQEKKEEINVIKCRMDKLSSSLNQLKNDTPQNELNLVGSSH